MGDCFYFGLDVGTTGCKAVVFDETGKQYGRGYREYPVVSIKPLQAEQDAENVFSLLLACMKEAVEESEIDDIQALSLSVQGDATILVDSAYRPLRPAVLGMDYRPQKQCDAYRERHDAYALYQRTGQPLHPINMLAKVMFLLEEEPELVATAHKMVTYEEFIFARLGGTPCLDKSMASRSMGYDLGQDCWSDEILATFGVKKEQLSEVAEAGSIIGKLSPEIAREIGLRGLPLLVLGGHDQPVGAVGAGVIVDSLALDSSGTAEVLSVTYPDIIVNQRMYDSFYSCYSHVVPGRHFSFAHMHVGGILLRWFRDQIGTEERKEAAAKGIDYYAYAQSKCRPGPSPILVLPHFNGSGTPICDVNSKGAIVGLTLSSTRHDILKGVLDSLCYELKLNIEAMEQAGVKIDTMRAVGGGARSPLWLQTKADITGKTIETITCKEAGCLGAAILSAVAAGTYTSLTDAVANMVHIDERYFPNQDSAVLYGEMNTKYNRLYGAMKEVFQS